MTAAGQDGEQLVTDMPNPDRPRRDQEHRMTAPLPRATGRPHAGLRYGQALFNDVRRVAPDIANTIRATDADPFYLDERVPDFLRGVVDRARADGAAEERERRRRTAVALAAVAPDLDRAGYDRARRECADELRADHPEDWKDNAGETDPRPWCWRCGSPWPCEPVQLADRWSSSGRASADEEEQR